MFADHFVRPTAYSLFFGFLFFSAFLTLRVSLKISSVALSFGRPAASLAAITSSREATHTILFRTRTLIARDLIDAKLLRLESVRTKSTMTGRPVARITCDVGS